MMGSELGVLRSHIESLKAIKKSSAFCSIVNFDKWGKRGLTVLEST